MTSVSFVYWLQGFFELTNVKTIDEKQTHLIKQHLALVFKHEIDPSMGDDKHQAELNSIHNGKLPVKNTGLTMGGIDSNGNQMRC